MSIENLMKAIPPPSDPVDAFRGPWAPIEAEVGLELPPDYKDFVGLYGWGQFMQLFDISVPRARQFHARFEAQVPRWAKVFQYDDEEWPYRVWPEAGGIVPFGSSENGDVLLWLAEGPPADWRVVLWDRGTYEFEAFDCDVTDFLAGLAVGDIRPKAFSEAFAPDGHLFGWDGPLFEPYRNDAAPTSGAAFSVSWRLGEIAGVSTCRIR